MCGRYSLEAKPHEIVEAFALAEAIAVSARYNIAPTQTAPVVRGDPDSVDRRLGEIRWGLTPGWSGASRPIINARSETIHSKPSFRSAFERRRCLVPASGFYEWQKLGSARQPFHIRRRGGGLLAFAGIWDRCMGPDGNAVEAFAILTTEPNRITAPIHDRMPVILFEDAYDLWLAPGEMCLAELSDLLAPAPDELLEAYPVSTHVNRTANDDPACVAPLADRETHLWDNPG